MNTAACFCGGVFLRFPPVLPTATAFTIKTKEQPMSQNPLTENKMGTMPVGKLLVNMALPMIISMMVQALYN